MGQAALKPTHLSVEEWCTRTGACAGQSWRWLLARSDAPLTETAVIDQADPDWSRRLYGSVYGDGDGSGSGSGAGAGYGYGYGYGSGSGSGYGYGSGSGDGDGAGDGSGDGVVAGAGYGSVYGDGDGDGWIPGGDER